MARDPDNKYLIAVETREFPGKAKLTYVHFTTEIVNIDDPKFVNKQFTLLDSRLPEARTLAAVLLPKD